MFVLSKEGDMVYLSENVEKHLGLTQIDLMGQSIYDFSHPCDHNDIKDLLALKTNIYSSHNDLSQICLNDNHIPNSFFVRMKCTLTNKGRNLNLKSAHYKVFTERLNLSICNV
jgi:PAS domain-containing protein